MSGAPVERRLPAVVPGQPFGADEMAFHPPGVADGVKSIFALCCARDGGAPGGAGRRVRRRTHSTLSGS